MSSVDSSGKYGCRNSGMPLGGIGAGSLELRLDGYFYRWYLMNNYEWVAGPATTVVEYAFAVYNASFGIAYDGFTRTLNVTPPDPSQPARFLVTLPSGCAMAHYKPQSKSVDLKPLFGSLRIDRIVINEIA